MNVSHEFACPLTCTASISSVVWFDGNGAPGFGVGDYCHIQFNIAMSNYSVDTESQVRSLVFLNSIGNFTNFTATWQSPQVLRITISAFTGPARLGPIMIAGNTSAMHVNMRPVRDFARQSIPASGTLRTYPTSSWGTYSCVVAVTYCIINSSAESTAHANV